MDSEFNPPESETEEKDMENVANTLAGLLYEQLGEETQLLVKKVHVAIPNHIRLVQDGLIRSASTEPLDKGEL